MQTPQSYVIESIRNLDGTVNEHETRRKGQRVEILHCTIGEPLLVCYRDDGNKLLRTSTVTNVLYADGAAEVVVYTQNTEYSFWKEAEYEWDDGLLSCGCCSCCGCSCDYEGGEVDDEVTAA